MPRSALYMPANNLRALAKAPSLPCDAVILDLEDSVAPTEKAAARQAAAAAMADPGMRQRPLILRTNALESAEFTADIAVARQATPCWCRRFPPCPSLPPVPQRSTDAARVCG